MATETRSVGFAQTWKGLARMPTYHVPMALGGFLAAFVGLLTYAFDAANGAPVAAATAGVIYTIIFGLTGLIGYAVSKENVQNGSLVAAIAGLALVAIVGGTTGLFAGLLLLVGAIWGLAASR
ncbi:MAG TPA: hypothetical protein VGR51_00170 [Thermoplasmata archaeon]|jgi:hypothetical protein|nr:hypothetical protein [Thermoplasmata archaeon]